MKITFQNFGIITEAEIELKPLTIFVGPNNSGKTWVAYALAGILGPYSLLNYVNAYRQGDIPKAYAPLDIAIEQVINHGTTTFDVVTFAENYAEIYFNSISHYIHYWMANFMGTELTSFKNLDISIELLESIKDIKENILNAIVRGEIIGLQEAATLTLHKASRSRELSVYTSIQDTSTEDISIAEQLSLSIPPAVIKDLLVKNVFGLLHRAIYHNVRVLPTERTTFIAHPYIVSRTKNIEASTTQDSIFQDETLQNLSGKPVSVPVSFFLSMMQTTYENEVLEKKQRERDAKNSSKVRRYIQLAHLLEEQILGGEVSYAHSGPQSPQIIPSSGTSSSYEALFQPTNGSKLEISIASSMVKELSPLLFYLRYLAKPADLIIIDEPEMNLHPEAQVKIIEFLAMLVNAGLNVLITTHSPYVVDHLTNLIKANDVEDKEHARKEFYLKQAEAFISKDKVSVYLFGEGKAIKAIDEEGVIELNTFGQVSDRISEIYFNL